MTSESDLLQSGIEALRAGRAAEAIAPLQRFVAAQPDNFEGNNFLGVALAQSGRAPDAIAYLSKATRLNPQSAPAQYNLGLAYLNVPSTEAARSALHNALQLDPSHQGAREALSRLPGGAHLATTSSGATAAGSGYDSGDSAPATIAASTASGAAASPWGFPTPPASATVQPAPQATRLSSADIVRAGAFGLGAAILGAVVWDKIVYYTNWQIGLIAVGVGWAVGGAVAAGARGKRGRSLQVMGALLACFAMLLGQALIVMDVIRRDFMPQGMEGLATEPLRLFLVSVMLVPRVLADNPLTLLFIAFGIWEGWRIPGAVPEAAPAEATTPPGTGTGPAV
jgi:hypothetical protein